MKCNFLLAIMITLVSCSDNERSFNNKSSQTKEKKGSMQAKSWQSEEFKIKISVPSNYTSVTPLEGEIVDFSTPLKNQFAIRAYNVIFPGTLDETRTKLEKSLLTQCPSCKVLISENIKIGKYDAAKILIDGFLGLKDGLYWAIPFHNNRNSFTLVGFCTRETRGQYEKELNDILKSIEFL